MMVQQLQYIKDGVKNNSLANSIDWTFKSLSFAIGSFGYEQQVEFAQIRMWKKCLSENVIKTICHVKLPEILMG